MADRKPRLAPLSYRSEFDHLKPLRLFFGATALTRITTDGIRAFIRDRSSAGLSNRTINIEVGILRRILNQAKRWRLVGEDIRPLPERRDVGRAMAPGQKLRLLRVAASRPEWETAYLAAVLALNTTMRGGEIKGLRWSDVDWLGKILRLRQSKTDAGLRPIPLNADALGVVRRLYDRAEAFGGPEPEHYLFPACESGKIDPTRPQKSWRTAWRSLTKEAGLEGLRFHDLRHHAITELAESDTSEQTILSIAGHVSPKMLAHYSHIRMKAKRNALDALASKPQPVEAGVDGEAGQSYVTNHVTNGPEGPPPNPQVVERSGGDDGTRTRDLWRDRPAF